MHWEDVTSSGYEVYTDLREFVGEMISLEPRIRMKSRKNCRSRRERILVEALEVYTWNTGRYVRNQGMVIYEVRVHGEAGVHNGKRRSDIFKDGNVLRSSDGVLDRHSWCHRTHLEGLQRTLSRGP